ncbi:hypothetical protein AOXY_G6143 [Acipenser oxyrinchus oxyrinchus]|uniref:Uncharacterized protein n=1 Tax=Acipenser oxyrinchus oxyrinchus TaxID=40147 RepID=A0AAD8LM28_ACIOX|nr:hypothetical protein AOXY_G6143 [Acipenser oxyrinchus oxyrinchus]
MYTAQQPCDTKPSKPSKVQPAAANTDIASRYKTEPDLRCDKPSGHEQRDLPVNPSGNQQNADIIPPHQNTIMGYR